MPARGKSRGKGPRWLAVLKVLGWKEGKWLKQREQGCEKGFRSPASGKESAFHSSVAGSHSLESFKWEFQFLIYINKKPPVCSFRMGRIGRKW